jgi:hypothetical protein
MIPNYSYYISTIKLFERKSLASTQKYYNPSQAAHSAHLHPAGRNKTTDLAATFAVENNINMFKKKPLAWRVLTIIKTAVV